MVDFLAYLCYNVKMKIKTNMYLKKIIAILLVLVSSPLLALAKDVSENIDETQTKINSVQSTLDSKRLKLSTLNTRIKEIQAELTPLRKRASSLQGQLENLDYLVNITTKKIETITEQIKKKELALGQVMERSDIYALKFQKEKKNLQNYARVLYIIESQFYDFQEKSINPFKLLIASSSISDTTRSLNYLSVSQKVEQKILAQIDTTHELVLLEETELNQARKQLDKLKEDLEGEKRDLDAQQEAKNALLEQTQGKESEYQKLLEDAIMQQAEVVSDVRSLYTNSQYLQSRLAQLEQFRANSGDGVAVYDTGVSYADMDYINTMLGETHQSFMWPVDPSRGISAYFHDQSYQTYFGVPHEAVDIRAYQDSVVYAPADGVVYKVRDNGYGYNYLIVAHGKNLLTVYGHISEFLVAEGDMVLQGQPIAKSGGTPGTVGAGTMTTGPHLHFEVYDNGTHVDPLDYLPVFDLPSEYIPQKYFQEVEDGIGVLEKTEE